MERLGEVVWDEDQERYVWSGWQPRERAEDNFKSCGMKMSTNLRDANAALSDENKRLQISERHLIGRLAKYAAVADAAREVFDPAAVNKIPVATLNRLGDALAALDQAQENDPYGPEGRWARPFSS